jgi:hypothetical protein
MTSCRDEPFPAFPSWLMRITCDRCGNDRMLSETHAAQGDMLIRDILKRMRHDGCGGWPGRAELLTGIAIRTNSRPDAPRWRQPPGAADRGDGRALITRMERRRCDAAIDYLPRA